MTAGTDYFTSATADTVIDAALGQGFVLPAKPTGAHPELPEDVSDLADADLVSVMVEFTAWCDYASAQLGIAAIVEHDCEREHEEKVADLWKRTLAGDPKISVTAMKVLQIADPPVATARKALDDSVAYRRLIADIAARYDRDAAVLSRELTRRTAGDRPARRWTP